MQERRAGAGEQFVGTVDTVGGVAEERAPAALWGRSLGVDLSTGAGVASALAGADTVVDVTSVTTSTCQPGK